MTLRREQPHFCAICKDSSSWLLKPESWDDFAAHWMAGKAFWSGHDIWDQPVVIKLGDVTGMVGKTAEALELCAHEDAEAKQRDLIDGAT